MRGPYQILLPLLGLFFCRVDLTDFYPLSFEVKLLKIYDGDTVLLTKGHYRFKLRISKIDSPEKGQPTLGHKIDGGEYAKNCLRRILLKEKALQVQIFGTDVFGRYLGDLNFVSLKMVSAGCAGLYPLATFKNKNEMFNYLRSLKLARHKNRGLYQYGGVMQPRAWRKINKRYVRRR